MAVRHAVLGLLAERRGYGLELASRLNDRLGSGFAVPVGTVYTALNALEADGHAVVTRRVRRGNQERVYYETTADGLRELDVWLEEPVDRPPVRGELYLRFALVDAKRAPALRQAFEVFEVECVADIARHTRAQQLTDGLPEQVSPDLVSRWLLDSAALDKLNADLAFVRRALSVLRWMETDGVVPRSTLLEAVSS